MAKPVSGRSSERTTESAPVERPRSKHVSRDPEKRARQLANLRPPWKPGEVANPTGKNGRGESFTEIVRRVAEGRVPPKLRERVARKLGTPLGVVDEMNMYEVLAAFMFFDYIEKGKFEQAQALLDRVDPKSRRVELDGEVRHKHAHLHLTQGMDEAEASNLYREALGVGTTVEIEGGSPQPAPAASTPEPDPAG